MGHAPFSYQNSGHASNAIVSFYIFMFYVIFVTVGWKLNELNMDLKWYRFPPITFCVPSNISTEFTYFKYRIYVLYVPNLRTFTAAQWNLYAGSSLLYVVKMFFDLFPLFEENTLQTGAKYFIDIYESTFQESTFLHLWIYILHFYIYISSCHSSVRFDKQLHLDDKSHFF